MDIVRNKQLLASAVALALGLGVSQGSMAATDIVIDLNATSAAIVNDGAGNITTAGDSTTALNVGDINFLFPVTITTSSLGAQAGTITLDTALDFDTYTTASLALTADQDININANIYDSNGLTADTLALTLSPTGVVNLNATIGEATNTTISGGLVIGATGTYNLINAADSLTADSITKDALGTFNYSAGSLTINSLLNIDSTGILGDTVTLNSNQSLHTASQSVGTIGLASGSLTQSGGTNTVDGVLTVNTGGTYNLNGGSLATGSDVIDGTINQVSGDHAVTGVLTVNSLGSYDLSGGTLSSNALATDGAFTQSGGTNTVTGLLDVQTFGSYTLSGGSLTADDITTATAGSFLYTDGDLTLTTGALAIDANGLLGDTVSIGATQNLTVANQTVGTAAASSGSLALDGGTNTVDGALTINAGGSYALNSGTLVANSIVNDGSMDVTGALTINAGNTYDQSGNLTAGSIAADGTLAQTAGTTSVTNTIAISDTGSYALSGGSLAADNITRTTAGTFTYTGGDLTLNSGTLAVETNGLLGATVAIGATQNLHTASQSIGTAAASSGSLTQTGGSNTVDGALTINAGGSYALNGGTLTTNTLDDSAGGAFIWTDGDLTLVADDLVVDSTGLVGQSLTLNNTKNLNTVNQTVGTATASSGSITQQPGSTNTVSGTLAINAGGTYGLNSAVLTAGSVSNDGAFTQSGSANTNITGALTQTVGSTYNLNGGSSTVGSIDNSGVYTHSLGSNTVSGTLTNNAAGTYALSNGALNANSISNSGTFTQTGGTSSVTNALTVNTGGSYALSAGALSADSVSNSGVFTQTGGSNAVTNALTIGAGGSYALDVGTLTTGSIDNSGAITQLGTVGDSTLSTTTLTMTAGSTYALAGGNFGYNSNCHQASSKCSALSTTTINNAGAITQTSGLVVSDNMTINNAGSYDQSAGYNQIYGSGVGTLTIDAGGSYNLSGNDNYYASNYSSLLTANLDNNGIMIQSGGHNDIVNLLTIGDGGSYAMSGGTLMADDIVRNGTGIFTFTGGSVLLAAGDLSVSSTGLLGNAVTMASGQSLQTVNQTINNGGSITQTGGTNTATSILTIDVGGSYDLNGGTLSAASIANSGTFAYTAGSVQLTNSDLNVDSAGLLGANLDIVAGESFDANNQTIGTGLISSGAITQTGGINNVDNILTINTGGSYTMSDGNLIAGSVVNNGAFNYTGGGVQLTNSDLVVDSSGPLGDTLNISAGQNSGGVNETVGTGIASSGFVNQTGGSNTIDNVLTINAGGSYTMSDGNLVAGSIVNNGAFNYTGGGVQLTNSDLVVDSSGILGDTLNIAAGQNSGGVNEIIGTATASSGFVNQTGGYNIIDGMLTINAGGGYSQSGGFLEGGTGYNTLNVSNSGVMTNSGGYTYLDNLTINAGGSYNLSGGYLTTNSITSNGDFNFTSGDLRLNSNLIVASGEFLNGASTNVSINSGMDLRLGSGNAINIASGASLTLDGGYIYAPSINNSGTFTFTSGSLAMNDLTIGTGGALGNTVTLSSAHNLSVNNSLSINSGATLNITSGINHDISSAITNNGNLVITGGDISTTTFTQTAGTTRVNGTLTASTVSIQGGLLDGIGTIVGDVEVGNGGTVAPGNSPGTLEIAGTFTLSAAGTLQLEVGDPFSDLLIATDYSLTGGNLEFFLIDSVDINAFTTGFSIDDFLHVGDLATNYGYLESGLSLTSFDNLVLSAYDSVNTQWYNLSLDATGGFSAVAAVPVPAAIWLFSSGLLGLVGVARRRAKAA